MNLAVVVCLVFAAYPLLGYLSINDSESNVNEIENGDENNTKLEIPTNQTVSNENNSYSGQDNFNQNSTTNNTTGDIEEPQFWVEYKNEELVEDDALILIAGNGNSSITLVNKDGEIIHNWTTDNYLGNDFQLLPNGDILALFKPDFKVPSMRFGGFGGLIQIISPSNEIKWSYEIANDTALAHHDVEMLPNGNVLVLVWELLNCSVAIEMGFDCQVDLAYESLYEINVTNNEVVWKWRSLDHSVQDRYPEKPNYGNITENKHRINFNHNIEDERFYNGDIMHANGIDYDEDNQLIYLSVNAYNEIWVIDHSTNTTQAASSNGGNYNVGGDLVYRFGNSLAYQSNESIIFINNHYPNLIEDPSKNGYENILVYSNGGTTNISTVYELVLPVSQYPAMTPPQIVWNYSNENLYSRIISGAERGLNNNTYIAEGDYGVWEVNQDGEVAWKFFHGPTWRAYVHYYDEPSVQNLLAQIT